MLLLPFNNILSLVSLPLTNHDLSFKISLELLVFFSPFIRFRPQSSHWDFPKGTLSNPGHQPPMIHWWLTNQFWNLTSVLWNGSIFPMYKKQQERGYVQRRDQLDKVLKCNSWKWLLKVLRRGSILCGYVIIGADRNLVEFGGVWRNSNSSGEGER